MKSLHALHDELTEIVKVREKGRNLVGHDYDSNVQRLTSMSAKALSNGGLERALSLVEQAIAQESKSKA